jgi:hypothetical protein
MWIECLKHEILLLKRLHTSIEECTKILKDAYTRKVRSREDIA